MKISSAEFVKGIVGTDQATSNDPRPQIVFLGRSNVGKSSLINSLTGKKELAISSSTPGRTQQINFFLINGNMYFVDFPGYGFARVSQKRGEKIRRLIMWYLEQSGVRPKLAILIIDGEVGPKEFDLEMVKLLQENGHPFVIVANKVDKIKNKDLFKQKKSVEAKLSNAKIIWHSSKRGQGRDQILSEIFA